MLRQISQFVPTNLIWVGSSDGGAIAWWGGGDRNLEKGTCTDNDILMSECKSKGSGGVRDCGAWG